MDLLKERLPSKREIKLLFFVCMVPVHIWAYAIFFYEFPGYILRLNIWELLRVLAYIQLVALAESTFFLAGIIFISVTLPTRFFRDKFLPFGVVVMCTTFLWILLLQYQPLILERVDNHTRSFQIFAFLWVISYFGIMLGTLFFVSRNQRFMTKLNALPERLTLLASIYLVFDILGFFLLTLRYFG